MTLTCRLHSYVSILLQCAKTSVIARRSAVNLAYKEHGKGSTDEVPVIVLHGLLGSKRNWESMSKNIAGIMSTRVIAVDARNHGESPHDDSHSYPDLAADVAKLLDTVSMKRAAVIGHSMGGRTGMVLALTQPDKVERLIVVDISPISTAGVLNEFFPNLIKVMKSVKFQGVSNLVKARKAAKETILASGVMESMEGMNFILMNIGVKPDSSVGWMCNLNALEYSFNTIATFPKEMNNKKYYGPTLFIGGELSNYLPRRDFTGIKDFFPNAELKYIANVGHN